MNSVNYKKAMMAQAVELQTLNGHTSDVTTCDFTADNILATGSSDKTVRIWKWQLGLGYVEVPHSPLIDHKYGITCVTFSPQGTILASCSRDGSTILWCARNGSKIHKFPQFNGDTVRVCKFLLDSCTLATASDDGIVCIWDLINRTLIRTIQHHEDSVQGLAFTFDSLFLTTTCIQGVMKMYSVADVCDTTLDDPSPLISINDAHDLGVLGCDFSKVIKSNESSLCSYYLLATCGNDHCLIQWIFKCRTEEKGNGFHAEINVSFMIKEAHSCAITCVRYNDQGNMLCTSSIDKCIKLWDNDGRCLQTLDGHERYVNCISFSRTDLILASGSNDKYIKVWDLSGQNLTVDSEITKPCTVMCHFGSGDLKGISTISEDNILLMKGDAKDNEVFLHQTVDNLHTAAINSLEFSVDGLLASGSGDKNVRLLKLGDDGFYAETDLSPVGSHRYQVNNVTFINSSLLASCSLDGNISLWAIDHASSRPIHIWSKSSASVKCIRANNYGQLMATYDDGNVAMWTLDPLSAAPKITYPEHADASTGCACSADGLLGCSASLNGDFRLYLLSGDNNQEEPVFVQDHAHDLGVQSVDFAPHHENLPIQFPEESICHLLATCGNDSDARIWKIILPKRGDIINNITCTEWRVFSGHGSSLTCIRFPPMRSDIVCTTSTDMQARIWSVYSAQCLHVLEHNSLVASCAFSYNCEVLATGGIEGQLTVWKLPMQCSNDTNIMKLIRTNAKSVSEWNSEDISHWLKETCFTNDISMVNRLLVRVHTKKLTGKQIINSTESQIYEMLNIDPNSDNDVIKYIIEELKWLRTPLNLRDVTFSSNVPHKFLCPITHDIMKDPVKCSDGFTYERRAINEWFLSGGKHVSPMTNQPLYNSEITPNKELKREIRQFIYENVST